LINGSSSSNTPLSQVSPRMHSSGMGVYSTPLAHSEGQPLSLNLGHGSISQGCSKRAPAQAASFSTIDTINALNLHNGLVDLPQLAVSVKLNSKKTQQDMLDEIKRALDQCQPELVYRHSENRFHLGNSAVTIEMELCQDRTTDRQLRFRKIAGDTQQYNKLCNQLLSSINL